LKIYSDCLSLICPLSVSYEYHKFNYLLISTTCLEIILTNEKEGFKKYPKMSFTPSQKTIRASIFICICINNGKRISYVLCCSNTRYNSKSKWERKKEINKRHVKDNDQKNSSFVSAISSMSCHSMCFKFLCSSQHFSRT